MHDAKLTAQAPPLVARWVGVPFDRMDCWALAQDFNRRAVGNVLPALPATVTPDDPDTAGQVAAQAMDSEDWLYLGQQPERVGDVGVFRIDGNPTHAGVAVSRSQMLHALEGQDSALEDWTSRLWLPRLVGWYRGVGPVHVNARPNPLGPMQHLAVPPGTSLADCLRAVGLEPDPACMSIQVGGQDMAPEAWELAKPKAGRVVTVAVTLRGSGASDNPLRLVLTIATLAAMVYFPPLAAQAWALSAAGQALVAGAIGVAGYFAANALAPMPRPKLSDLTGRTSSPSPSLTGQRNEARPYGVVPVVLGDMRVVPPLAALPYTEVVGQDQYLRLLYVVGEGPLLIGEPKIGDTPLSDYEGVQYEVRQGYDGDSPITLYPGVVLEDVYSTTLTQAGGPLVRTSQVDADELSVDVTFPTGLAQYDAAGDRQQKTVELTVEYSPTGAGTWSPIRDPQAAVDQAAMDYYFREPESTFGDNEDDTGPIQWSSGSALPDAKPSYLPSNEYGYEATFYVYTPHGGTTVLFGLDCSESAEVWVDGRLRVSAYDRGGLASSGGTPARPVEEVSGQYSFMRRGWHQVRVRMTHAEAGEQGLCLWWKPTPALPWEVIPAASISKQEPMRSGGWFGPPVNLTTGDGSIRVAWFDAYALGSTITVSESTTSTVRVSRAWPVPTGQYDVRVTRTTADSSDPLVLDTTVLTALRTIRHQDPVQQPGLALVALRIKATDQLQGQLDQFNVRAVSVCQEYFEAAGVWAESASNNPAALYRHVLQGRGNRRPLADARLDLTTLQAWHDRCRTEGWTYNAVLDTPGTVWERLLDVAGIGRASPTMRDGLFSVAADQPQSVPVQVFTPRNSWGFQGHRAYPTIPHCLLVQFLDEDNGYQAAERPVYADGYDDSTATLYETVEALGCTNADQAWSLGRYWLAVMQLRPETWQLNVDAEHLLCGRGDLVQVQHDVPLVGLGSARVVRVDQDGGGNVVQFAIDAGVPMESGKSYQVRLRDRDGTVVAIPVDTVVGPDNTELTPTTPVPTSSTQPGPGDLVAFGEVGTEVRDMVVQRIDPGGDLTAQVTLVDHAPAVHTADDGPIPAWDPGITQPPDFERGPADPVLESVRSDEWVMIRLADGSLVPRILLTLRNAPANTPRPVEAQVRTKPIPAGGTAADAIGPWDYRPTVPIDAENGVGVLDVQEGITYLVAIRVVDADSRTSSWVQVEHTVLGKQNVPPDVSSFDVVRLGDGTRRYTWDLGATVPPDLAGVEIRYGAVGTAWASMTRLVDQPLQGSPQDVNRPVAGTWDFAIKAVDLGGLASANELRITRTLGPARQEGVVFSQSQRAQGWPGTLFGLEIDAPAQYLQFTDGDDWTDPTDWASWSIWNGNLPAFASYQPPDVDMGAVLDVDLDASVDQVGNDDYVLLVRYSTDGLAFSSPVPLDDLRGQAVTARYLRYLIQWTSPTTPVQLRDLVLIARAEQISQELDDVDMTTLGGLYKLATGDVRLPIDPSRFALVRTVSLGFNGVGAGWTWEVVDKQVDPGPRVRVYDPLGNPADAIIDATVRGV